MKYISKSFHISLTRLVFTSESIGSNVSFVDSDHAKVLGTERKSVHFETPVCNDVSGKFFVGPVRYVKVFEIDKSGGYRQVIKDDKPSSIRGIAVDEKQGKLVVKNSDLGMSVNSNYDGTLNVAGLGS